MERIDTIATALHAGFTVDRLIDLYLSYAPPFSPVWDPVQIAAKKKAGLIEKEINTSPRTLKYGDHRQKQ